MAAIFEDAAKILGEDGLKVAEEGVDGFYSLSNGLKLAEGDAAAASSEFGASMAKAAAEDSATVIQDIETDAPNLVKNSEDTIANDAANTKSKAQAEANAKAAGAGQDVLLSADKTAAAWGTKSVLMGVGTTLLAGDAFVSWGCTNGVQNVQIVNIKNGASKGLIIVNYTKPTVVAGISCYMPCAGDVVDFVNTGIQGVDGANQMLITNILTSSSFIVDTGITSLSVPSSQSGGSMTVNQTLTGSATCTVKNTLAGIIKAMGNAAAPVLTDIWDLIKKYVIWGGIILAIGVLIWILVSLIHK